MDALTILNLKKSFRRHFYSKPSEVLKNISFSVKEGSVTGFLGANGSGKTTTIKCILGLIFPDEGEILLWGKPFSNLEVRRQLGFLPERPYFYDHLTGAEFLKFYGQISGLKSNDVLQPRVNKLLERVGLGHAKDKPLREYSKGMLQRVGIAQALIHSPKFVIFDEPMTGLDPDGRWEVRDLIREVSQSGVTVFFSSHLLHDAEMLCDDLVILKSGQVVFTGTTRSLLDQVSKKVTLQYLDKQDLKTEEFLDLQATQPKIDILRKQGATIVDLRTERGSLEDAFMNIAFNGAHKHVDNLGHR
jgi:ABC-2 type transport system ATP-binding protein